MTFIEHKYFLNDSLNENENEKKQIATILSLATDFELIVA